MATNEVHSSTEEQHQSGLENGSEKTQVFRFLKNLKNLKSPKFRFFCFFFIFWSNFIQTIL